MSPASFPPAHFLPAGTQSLAVGFSGGADSFALLHMMHLWARDHGVTVHALTVDHGLRPESATEAQTLHNWCRDHGITHHILTWHGEKPTSAIQDSARQARRRLLCNHCHAEKIPVLLLGHQRNDQAETLLMRMMRGTGLSGLRAIRERSIDTDTNIHILRPLLDWAREDLRAYCVTHALPFIDDPSNNNPHYERVRMRHILSALPAIPQHLTTTLQRLTRADDALEHMAQQWITQHIHPLDDAQWFARKTFDALPNEMRIRILTQLLHHYGQNRPSLSAVEKLSDALGNDSFFGETLGPLWIRPKKHAKQDGYVVLHAPARSAKDA